MGLLTSAPLEQQLHAHQLPPTSVDPLRAWCGEVIRDYKANGIHVVRRRWSRDCTQRAGAKCNDTNVKIHEVVTFNPVNIISVELVELLVILEKNRLDDYVDDKQKHIYINLLVEVANIIKTIHNTISGLSYFQATHSLLNRAFHHCKKIIYNYHKLK